MASGNPHGREDVVAVAGDNQGQGCDLVDAGVGGVEAKGHGIREDFSLDLLVKFLKEAVEFVLFCHFDLDPQITL